VFDRLIVVLVVAFASASVAHAQPKPPSKPEVKPDPVAVLAAAKSASGGAAWDALRTQRSEVKLAAANLEGSVERWSDIATGRSMMRYRIGPIAGAAGNDGKQVWTQDESEEPKIETGAVALELAANAAYRDRLAFWYPDRARAKIEYKDRADANGRKYDVVTIVPEAGRPFEFWIDVETKLIERLVEREADVTRTEVYSDRREVQGVRIPFHVHTSRGDPKLDEVVDVQKLAFNEPLADVAFGPPVAKAEIAFPPGRASVEAPFEALSGHLFVNVMLDGRGPFRMLFDAGGANVLTTQAAAAIAGPGRAVPKTLLIASTTINGVEVGGQRYAVADIDPLLRRVEGLDGIAGVLGLEWFVRMPIRIDYARSRITFYDPAQFKAGSGTKVPVAKRGRLPQVNGAIDGIEGVFEIDTGSRGSLTLTPAFVAKNDLAKKLAPKNVAITGSGVAGPVRASLARAKSLKLGAVEIANPIVALPQVEGESARTDVAGNVGFALMRQFAVTYDLANDALYFERYLNFGSPDIADRGGMWLERSDDGFKVVDVVTGGPAASAGLKAGDMIVEVNGYPSAQLLLPAVREVLRAPPGARVKLKKADGNEVTVVLRDLV
jgi:PDZ domain/Aspartyl protease